jgi:hypothetical protein
MSKRTIIGIAVVLILLGLFCIVGFIILAPAIQNVYVQLTAAAEEPGEQFLQALKAGDYVTAYSLCNADLQVELGNAQVFSETIPRFTGWTMESQSITTNTNEAGVSLNGDLTYYNGAVSTYELVMLYEDGVYKVAGFHFGGIEDVAVLLGDTFMEALRNKDYKTAYGLFESNLQSETESAEYLAMIFPKLTFWTIEARQITTNTKMPGVSLEGEVTFYNDFETEYELVLVLVNGEYHIAGFNFPELFLVAVEPGEAFLQALKADDYQAAYDLFAPNLLVEISSPEALQEMIPPDIDFVSWDMAPESYKLNDGTESVVLRGILVVGDGSEVDYNLVMVIVEGEYLLGGFNFQVR